MRRLILTLLTTTLSAAPAMAHPSPPPGLSCPGDRIVWVDVGTGVYYTQGEHRYGRTLSGLFECEKQALAEGDRLSRKGK